MAYRLRQKAVLVATDATADTTPPTPPARVQGTSSWEHQYQLIDTILAGLVPSEPLIDRTGEAKLNMFLSCFSMAGSSARGWIRLKS